MSTLEVLRAARATIAENWCQGTSGSPPHRSVGNNGSCAWMAIRRLTLGSLVGLGDAERALLRVIGGRAKEDVFRFNDSHTHAEVLAMFDRAIAVEEAKAAEFTATPEPAPLVAA